MVLYRKPRKAVRAWQIRFRNNIGVHSELVTVCNAVKTQPFCEKWRHMPIQILTLTFALSPSMHMVSRHFNRGTQVCAYLQQRVKSKIEVQMAGSRINKAWFSKVKYKFSYIEKQHAGQLFINWVLYLSHSTNLVVERQRIRRLQRASWVSRGPQPAIELPLRSQRKVWYNNSTLKLASKSGSVCTSFFCGKAVFRHRFTLLQAPSALRCYFWHVFVLP